MKIIFVYIASFLCVISVGFFAGIYFQNNYVFSGSETSKIHLSSENSACPIPIISINPIENGELFISRYTQEEKGEDKHTFSEVRILTNNEKESLKVLGREDESIVIDASSLLPKIEKIPSPPWAMFVASKSGSVFWPLDNPRAFILSPKNRVFFKDKNDAIDHGYRYGMEK